MESIIVNSVLPVVFWIIVAAFAILLLFIFIDFLNPANKFKGLIGTALLGALIFGVYTISSGDIPTKYLGKDYSHITEFVMKYTTAGVTVAVLMILLGFALWIVLEILNLAK